MAAILWGISFLAISCAKPGSTNKISIDSQNVGILNGKPVTSADVALRSVVKVNAKGTAKNRWEGALCTGTLVEKQFVVTAAHCLIADDGTPFAQVTVTFLSAETADGTRPTKIRGKAFLIHPLFGKVDQASYDVGLILLESEAPSDSRPANIPLSYADLKNPTLYAAGLGDTEKDDNPNGKLHWAPVQLLTDSEIIKTKAKERMLEVNSKEGQTFVINQDRANSTGTCQGDSGGPLFHLQDSIMVLWGIISSKPDTGCLGKTNVYSIPYLRRFFAGAFHQLRKLGKLEGKAHIPAWENRDSISTDSQNIEIWRPSTKLPFELKLANEFYSFKKARLISESSLHRRMYKGNSIELQISTDDKFNCNSEALKEHSSPTIAFQLLNWPRRKMVEAEGYFLVVKYRQVQRENVRVQVFEINEGRAKFNIMNANNPVVSVEIDVLDCRN